MARVERAPRDRLLRAAESRFRRFGYRRTSVEDITREAGTGKGSLYLHFRSKQDVYLAVVESSLQRFVAKAATVLRGPGQVPERLRSLVELTARHYGRDELLRASLFGEAHLVDGRVSDLAAAVQRSRIRELLAEVIEAGQREGSVRGELDARATAAVLFEIGWAIVRSHLDGEADLRLDSALGVLNDVVGRGILARSTSTTRFGVAEAR